MPFSPGLRTCEALARESGAPSGCLGYLACPATRRSADSGSRDLGNARSSASGANANPFGPDSARLNRTRSGKPISPASSLSSMASGSGRRRPLSDLRYVVARSRRTSGDGCRRARGERTDVERAEAGVFQGSTTPERPGPTLCHLGGRRVSTHRVRTRGCPQRACHSSAVDGGSLDQLLSDSTERCHCTAWMQMVRALSVAAPLAGDAEQFEARIGALMERLNRRYREMAMGFQRPEAWHAVSKALKDLSPESSSVTCRKRSRGCGLRSPLI